MKNLLYSLNIYVKLLILILKNDFRSYFEYKSFRKVLYISILSYLFIFSILIIFISLFNNFFITNSIMIILFIILFLKNSNEKLVILFWENSSETEKYLNFPVKVYNIFYLYVIRSIICKLSIFYLVYLSYLLLEFFNRTNYLVIFKGLFFFLTINNIILLLNLLSIIIKLSFKNNFFINLINFIWNFFIGNILGIIIIFSFKKNIIFKNIRFNISDIITKNILENIPFKIYFIMFLISIIIFIYFIKIVNFILKNIYLNDAYKINDINFINISIIKLIKKIFKNDIFILKDLLIFFRNKNIKRRVFINRINELIIFFGIIFITYIFNLNNIININIFIIFLITEIIILDFDIKILTNINEEKNLIKKYILSSFSINHIIKEKIKLELIFLETYSLIITIIFLMFAKLSIIDSLFLILIQSILVMNYSICVILARSCFPRYIWKNKYNKEKNLKAELTEYIFEYIFLCYLILMYIIPNVLIKKGLLNSDNIININSITIIILGNIITIIMYILIFRKVANPYGEFE